MQVTQAEEPNVRRVGVQEEYIKFRPSPNFKNMKKFLKNRSNHHSVTPEPQCEKLDRKEIKPVVVQPPLPPYPPPPDSPPNLNIVIKQEKEDDDESQSSSGGEGDHSQELTTSEERAVEQTEERPKKEICKEFIRGNCKRPVCRYAHEVDVSQLAGVYTFCWNYQNAVCTFPNCRFVHASVFEEAEFYRTGVLPPHARSHLKKPSPTSEETQQEMKPSNFTNLPPPVHPTVDKSLPILSCVPTSTIEQRPEDEMRNLLSRNVSPFKRGIEEFTGSPRELEVSEHLAKKCKNCDIGEFSLKYNKEMMENISQSSEEIIKKIAQISKKSTKLLNVLYTVVKQMSWNKTATVNNGIISADKEKAFLDQLNTYLSNTNNRMSSLTVINDDNLKNMQGGNMNLTSLMAKILCSASEQALPNESSRET
ncbi:uncharacterized protein LOC126380699 isoform X2 [Pectinophora gossypiella]|uniref:C3H1-type domain-containing protein n=1 Tax=Pectinophora gossypiella TaxID=13191 RepID=A0A1E1WCP4_PECGO|nr:uncharacterized protein LOC126380699 isoform X2 [Pectinophora gossypiella]XP_049886249.1 uncharacterized protein LOC126380699 isoform X2 [Pectinophora gossypiella]